jgi:endonuclease YncB( thermonuclease family)
MIKQLLFLPFLMMPLLAVGGESLDGQVAAIVDGDTLMVDVPARGQLRLRLAWIDAPDRLQEHGEASRVSLSALASGQPARIELISEAKGLWRAIVWVSSPDMPCRNTACPKALDLGLAQVARGMAWHDRRSLGQAAQALGQYEHAEFQAKIRRTGLWAGKNPSPPWDWRGR